MSDCRGLELLGAYHGHEEVNKQQQGDEAHNEVFHTLLLHLLAKADVEGADHKEQHRDGDINQVGHRLFKSS